MKFYSVIWVLVVLYLVQNDGARILGVFYPPLPSHFNLGNKLMVELAKRGHEVTFISSFERKEPVKGIRDVVLTRFSDGKDMEGIKEFIMSKNKANVLTTFMNAIKMFSNMTENVFRHSNVQALFSKTEKFDLIIMQAFMNEAHMGFGYHFQAPTVLLSTLGSSVLINEYVRNAANPAFVPELMGDLPPKMGFWDRVKNTLLSNALILIMHSLHFPTQDGILHKYFPDAPPVVDLMHYNISIILLNSHSSFGVAKPMVPNMVEIGGYHVDAPKEIPKSDLKQYLDNAQKGFILFSMGSNLQSTMLPLEMRKILMTVFSKLPYKVLWKFEDSKLEGKPENVKIHKWLPQNDILAHPNLKLFITHGGLLSTTEAVYHGVPIVGIPVFADQKANMANSERLGIGKTVEFENLSEETLLDVINEVLNNPIYRDNIRQRSTIFRDQPVTPIDTAIFWIEYSIRNGYANHLKTSAIDLKWYQIMLLDVMAILVLGIFAILAILFLLIKNFCCGKKQKLNKLLQQKNKKLI